MLRFLAGGIVRCRLAIWVAAAAFAVEISPLSAQYVAGNCGCPAVCGCGAAPGALPGQPADRFYDGEMAPGDGIPFTEGEGATPPGTAGPGTAGAGAAPGLQLTQQFGGGGQFFVVNMIGGLNGGMATTSLLPVDLLRAATSDIDPNILPTGADPNGPWTVVGDLGQPGPIGVYEPGAGPLGTGNLLAVFPDQQIGFTTAITAGEVVDLLNNNGAPQIPITNDTQFDYEDVVTQQFATRQGPGGTVMFVPEESFAVPQAPGSDDYDVVYTYRYFTVVPIQSPSGSAIVGRFKVSDNNSPMPRDRVYYDYSYFHNVPFTPDGLAVSRFAPGIEKTFLGGLASLELRVPMAVGLNSDIAVGTGGTLTGDVQNGEFGNLSITAKGLLIDNGTTAVAAGLGVTAPTADDVRVSLVDGTPLVHIENESVHLTPYVAMLYTPNDRFFFQSWIQVDMDANGNPVQANLGEPGMSSIGRLDDQTLLYVDTAFGSWLYRNPQSRYFRGAAWSIEAHYTTSVDDLNTLTTGNGLVIGDPSQDLDILNMTIGGHVQYGSTIFTAGYGVPVTEDRLFDGELRMLINRYW